MNQFLHVDALEYTAAFQRAVPLFFDEIEKLLDALDRRIAELEQRNVEVPSYLFAAYRGYEAALVFKHHPETFQQPFVVKLRDNQ